MNTRLPHAYVLDVMSDDHPGIIAAVGQEIVGKQGNIDAVSQTVLSGYFTLIMIVSFAEEIDPDGLVADICRHHPGYQVVIRPFVPVKDDGSGGHCERFVVTAFGDDREGIVLQFSQYLAGKDINIVDLYGRRRGGEFVLLGQVDIPDAMDLGMLQADLEEMGRSQNYTVRLQHENIFVATNQLQLRRDIASGRLMTEQS